MAREYPRFLFSDPQNTKSKGPFIVHTLPPRLIFKVRTNDEEWESDDFGAGQSDHDGSNSIYVILLDVQVSDLNDDIEQEDKYRKLCSEALQWLTNQQKTGAIKI